MEKTMSLRTIVQRLGGELYAGGRRANIPAPGHSQADRSVSLLLDGERLLIHTFGAGDWRQVRDFLRDQGLLTALQGADGQDDARFVAARRSEAERRAVAGQLWRAGRAIARTPSERYCRARKISGPLPGFQVLRHHGLAPLSVYRPGPATRPALMAAITDPQGALAGIELTYLTQAGRRTETLRLPRKTVGVVPAGSAVRLDAPAPDMVVAEGLFTALSARSRFALPAWALLSTGNLRAWRPPPGVRSVTIAADRGKAGEAAAAALARALRGLGVRTRLSLPPIGFGDWNDVAMSGGAREEKGGAEPGEPER
jgi:hypothetical protein